VVRTVGWRPDDRAPLPPPASERAADLRRELQEAVGGVSPAGVIVASATDGGGAPASWIPRTVPAWWWPTAIGGGARGLGFGRRVLPPLLPSWSSALDAGLPGPAPPLGSAQSLWDGPYVLCPQPLVGRSRGPVLEAFAGVASGEEALDLVVLGDPDPQVAHRARELGVGTRVHFAGPAARGAEWPWLACARAMVVAGETALPAGLVWRALAVGCPVLAHGARGAAAEIRVWLAAHQLAWTNGGGLASALAVAIERPAALEQVLARGRMRAAAQSSTALVTGLGAALSPLGAPATRRAAA
jgi:hypothetical protein